MSGWYASLSGQELERVTEHVDVRGEVLCVLRGTKEGHLGAPLFSDRCDLGVVGADDDSGDAG